MDPGAHFRIGQAKRHGGEIRETGMFAFPVILSGHIGLRIAGRDFVKNVKGADPFASGEVLHCNATFTQIGNAFGEALGAGAQTGKVPTPTGDDHHVGFFLRDGGRGYRCRGGCGAGGEASFFDKGTTIQKMFSLFFCVDPDFLLYGLYRTWERISVLIEMYGERDLKARQFGFKTQTREDWFLGTLNVCNLHNLYPIADTGKILTVSHNSAIPSTMVEGAVTRSHIVSGVTRFPQRV